MYIKRITQPTDLEPYRQRWDALAADCVFRTSAWLTTWWKHYGTNHQLYVLLVFADEATPNCRSQKTCTESTSDNPDQLVAILPCYLEKTFARGRVLRLLGDGEVCSDHLDLLADPANLPTAATALARYLSQHADDWDLANLTAIPNNIPGLAQLTTELQNLDYQVTRTPNANCWAIDLPEDWEAFLALQSKSHRKKLRRLERRVLENEQAVWHLVKTPEQFAVAWPILVDLHQRRRNSLGEPGCFASQLWADFHHDIAAQLLAAGQLRLSWLELAGQPVAAEYLFADKHTTWAYQAGVDPDRIDEEPGRLSMIRILQRAIDEGHQQFDLLRGDEPYKAHWRATPLPTFDLQIVPPRNTARWRFQAYNSLRHARRLARQITNMLG